MGVDPLADVLASVRLTGAVLFAVEGAAPWAAEAPPAGAIAGRVMPGADHVLEFHAVTRGRCLGGIVGEPPVALQAGDVICFPHGDAHVLSSEAGLRAPPTDPAVVGGGPAPFILRIGAGEPADRLVCGFLGCDLRPFNPLLAALPRVLVAHDHAGPHGGWLWRLAEAAEAEARRPRPGGAGVLARLTEVMFLEVVRRHLEALPPDRGGWLAGLRDPQVGRALAAIHAEPGRGWSLGALARAAGASRTALAERFAGLVGAPPMAYLARWRMQVAAGLLAGTEAAVAEVAARVGYGSEAAFSRAFKRATGAPPAAWRRARARPPTGEAEAAAAPGP